MQWSDYRVTAPVHEVQNIRGSIFLKDVTYSEVSKIKMLAQDGMEFMLRLLKYIPGICNAFSEPLLVIHILNVSITQGVIPDELKNPHVIHVLI